MVVASPIPGYKEGGGAEDSVANDDLDDRDLIAREVDEKVNGVEFNKFRDLTRL